MKNAVFWNVAPCTSHVNRRFGGTYCFHLEDRIIHERGTSRLLMLVPQSRIFYPEDGGDTFLRNIGSHTIYTAPHPRRRHSSYYLFLSIMNLRAQCFDVKVHEGYKTKKEISTKYVSPKGEYSFYWRLVVHKSYTCA
jgi:hypothetical protein